MYCHIPEWLLNKQDYNKWKYNLLIPPLTKKTFPGTSLLSKVYLRVRWRTRSFIEHVIVMEKYLCRDVSYDDKGQTKHFHICWNTKKSFRTWSFFYILLILLGSIIIVVLLVSNSIHEYSIFYINIKITIRFNEFE